MWMLIDLIISNAIKAALREVSSLAPEEVIKRIIIEEQRKAGLTAELYR